MLYSKDKKVSIIVWFVIIVSSNCFGLYQIAAQYTNIYFTDMIAITLATLCLVYEALHLFSEIRKIPRKRCIKRYAWLFLLWTFLEIIYTAIRYVDKQTVVTTIKESIVYIAPILVFFTLIRATNNGVRLEKLISIMINVSIICSIVAVIAFFSLSITGHNYFNLDVENYSFVRNGRGHFMIGTMIVIPATLFLWVRIINGQYKFKNLCTLVLNLFHIVYIGQTRTLIMYILVSMAIIYILVSDKSKKLKVLISLVCVVIFVCVEASSIFSGFALLLGDNSVTYRMEAISFYSNQLRESPVFGMGFIGASNSSLSLLLYGPYNRYYRTDVGLVGFSNCMGLVGCIWYISLILYCLGLIRRMKKLDIEKTTYLYFTVFYCFILISSINLFIIDSFRLIYLPLLLLLAIRGEHLIKNYKEN